MDMYGLHTHFITPEDLHEKTTQGTEKLWSLKTGVLLA